MLFRKCRNSVFCACFLFFFLLGTISGTFAFRCLLITSESMLDHIVRSLPTIDSGGASALWSSIRPLLVVSVFALHPQGYRAVFALVFLRGFLMAYFFAALAFGGGPVWMTFAEELFVLVVFYILSKWVYFRWELSSSHRSF